ncbi:pyrroline-5-carboxylate reductase family protein [Motiliproteus sp.]|uniref:pyrroline-5-carboxylate reductase family protein n=1 Tax=Motiliproteus sp. TaxID=1898955 RepID=UPI003BAA46A9
MLKRVGLVGATGWMGALIGQALLSGNRLRPEQLSCLNRSASNAGYAAYPAVKWAANFSELIELSDTLILSVRPEQFRDANFCCGDKLVISLMAGIPIKELADRTAASRIIRAMPNSAAEIGRSFTPWFASPETTATDRQIATAILEAIGETQQLDDEQQLNVLTGLSGAGPAYTALLISALSQAAINAGIPEAIALKAATATAVDAAQVLSRSDRDSETIIHDYLSYDGVITAALKAAQTSGFYRSINHALLAANQKVTELESQGDESPTN